MQCRRHVPLPRVAMPLPPLPAPCSTAGAMRAPSLRPTLPGAYKRPWPLQPHFSPHHTELLPPLFFPKLGDAASRLPLLFLPLWLRLLVRDLTPLLVRIGSCRPGSWSAASPLITPPPPPLRWALHPSHFPAVFPCASPPTSPPPAVGPSQCRLPGEPPLSSCCPAPPPMPLML
jgi:hypothetical protein